MNYGTTSEVVNSMFYICTFITEVLSKDQNRIKVVVAHLAIKLGLAYVRQRSLKLEALTPK